MTPRVIDQQIDSMSIARTWLAKRRLMPTNSPQADTIPHARGRAFNNLIA
jgi:hypothetical protein